MKVSELTQDQLADLFLLWWNDFLSVDTFADYLGVDDVQALRIIDMGRDYHDARAEKLKLEEITI